MIFSMIFETREVGHTVKILQITVIKAGLSKKGFHNGGFVNLSKCARGEGFVVICSQCWRNCVKTLKQMRRRNGIEFAGFWFRFVQNFTYFFLRDRRETERQEQHATEG